MGDLATKSAVKGNVPLSICRAMKKNIKENYELYLMSLPVFIFFIIFSYIPMYGVQIAFKSYTARGGILGSPWVGIDNFVRFFNSPQFFSLLKNTLGISLYQLVAGFPFPIVLALMINSCRGKVYRKVVQMVTYAPHFISIVVLVGMINIFLSPSTGIVNKLIGLFGVGAVDFLSCPEWFKTIFVFTGIWQNAGWGSIIYIAALSGIDPELHEAAKVDGASKFKRILNIDIPGILPTAVVLLILNMGQIMNVGFEKVFLMQNPLNMVSSDVISTYVYRSGILGQEFSFSTAIGVFNSLINCMLLVIANSLSKRLSETSLW